MYQLKTGANVNVQPTIGFNVETVNYKNVQFSIYDIGYNTKFRGFWSHYMKDTDALIYVIDSNDAERLLEAKEELSRMLECNELKDVPVLIYANK